MPQRQSDTLRNRLLDRAVQHLVTDALSAAEAAVPLQAVAAEENVARQTAYRYLGSASKALVHAARRMFERERDSVRARRDILMEAYRSSDGEDRVETYKRLFALNFLRQFSNPVMPAGWLIHAAIMSRSPAWAGDPKAPLDDKQQLADEIREIRRQFYEDSTEDLEGVLQIACRAVGRTLAPEVKGSDVVMLVNALFDGMVLRAAIDPDRARPELVGDAMYRLAEAFTVPLAPVRDPRRPLDEERAQRFDTIVLAGIEAYKAGGSTHPPTFAEIAAMADLDEQVVQALFEDSTALADSCARTLVALDEVLDSVGKPYALDVVSEGIRLLAVHVDAMPMLFGHLHEAETSTVLSDLEEAVRDVLLTGVESGRIVCGAPDRTARDLVELAMIGSEGAVPGIETAMAAMDPREVDTTTLNPTTPPHTSL